MILPVLKYGNPVLRQKGERIERITPDIRTLIVDMLETMYGAAGIGLAAQQIGRPLQLTVIDVRGAKDRPSTLEVNGLTADITAFMPLILINPVIKPLGQPVSGPEGCLSFPEIYADISRSDHVEVTALNQGGQQFQFRCSGLLARAAQHEGDHLRGILFIDRMSRETKMEHKEQLDRLQAATREILKKGEPDRGKSRPS